MAAGFSSSNSTVACIASATDLKKSERFLSPSASDDFQFSGIIAASVPSLPQMRLIKFPGSFKQRLKP